jgi:hypothetical protein
MNQSGIKVSSEISSKFLEARSDEKIAWIKMKIEGEETKLISTYECTDSYEDDIDSLAKNIKDDGDEDNCAYFGKFIY